MVAHEHTLDMPSRVADIFVAREPYIVLTYTARRRIAYVSCNYMWRKALFTGNCTLTCGLMVKKVIEVVRKL